jgi:hypothetical protein
VKRSLPLVALTLAALLAPAAALAAPIAGPITRSFEIRALVLGATRLEVSGKLWLDGTNLGASVGCNSIGAQVSIDGDVVTIVGPAMMTEMACPGFNDNAEAMLAKILELGRFTIADGKWSADGGSIEVIESPAPDPNAVPPDQPIGKEPGVVCGFIVPDDPANGVDGGSAPDAGSGSGSGSSGGSSGGATEPDPGTDAPPVPAATANDLPCVIGVGGGVQIDPAPGGPVEPTSSYVNVDMNRDVLFVPLAIGFGLVLLLTAGLLLRGRPTPR